MAGCLAEMGGPARQAADGSKAGLRLCLPCLRLPNPLLAVSRVSSSISFLAECPCRERGLQPASAHPQCFICRAHGWGSAGELRPKPYPKAATSASLHLCGMCGGTVPKPPSFTCPGVFPLWGRIKQLPLCSLLLCWVVLIPLKGDPETLKREEPPRNKIK